MTPGPTIDAEIDVVEVSARTLADGFARVARQIEGGEVAQAGPVRLIASGTPLQEFNVAFVHGPVVDANATLDEIASFYARIGVPYRVMVPLAHAPQLATAALERGHVPRSFDAMTLMPIETAPAPHDVVIERVTDAATMAVFSATVSVGFGGADDATAAINGPWLLRDPGMAFFVAYIDGEPAGTALVCVTDEIAGIYGVATLEAFRRRGVASALTSAALREGARQGCVIGALQPSDMGRPVYERMGFRPAALFMQFTSD